MSATLTSLVRRVHIMEEITKNWNRMQQELTTINTEVAAVRESQRALTTLMEGILTRLDTVVETEPPPEESVDPEATCSYLKFGSFDGSSVQVLPMERLAMILEVASTEADTTPVQQNHHH